MMGIHGIKPVCNQQYSAIGNNNGLFPAIQSTLGLIPIFGNDVWLHALTAAIAAYFGFIVKPDLLELRTGESAIAVRI
jgi:hypothetical protein